MKKKELINQLKEADPISPSLVEGWVEGDEARMILHQILEAETTRSPAPRRRRMRGRLIILPVAALLFAGVAAVYVQNRQTTNPLAVACYGALTQDADTAVLMIDETREGMTPEAICAPEWPSAFGETAPRSLVSCVVTGGATGVFPNPNDMSQQDACGSIGASVPEEGSYAGATAQRIRKWARDLAARYEQAEGTSGCMDTRTLMSLIQQSFDKWDLNGWTVSERASQADLQCSGYSIEADRARVVVVNDH